MRKRIVYLFLVLGFLLPAASSVQGRAVAYATTKQKDATGYITKTGEKYHKVAACLLFAHDVKLRENIRYAVSFE